MATIRLVPSSYELSSTSYLSISNASNMYNNTDNTTYATITNSRNQTSSYYVYLRGFNFDDIPSSAIVNSFTIKLKARQSGVSTSDSYKPYLANDTNAINGSCDVITTTVTTHTFSGLSADWDDIVNYGADFGIRINCRRSNRNTTAYMYIYGAEIEVEYTIPDPASVTSVLVSGNGTLNPLGTTNTYEDAEYTLIITPSDTSEEVVATKNGIDITEDLVAHYPGGSLTFTSTNATTSGVQSGSSYAQYAVGRTAENPYSSSSNMYASSGSTGYAAYSFDFSDIPNNAIIDNIEVKCYGHRESSTISSTYVSQCILYQGSTAISDEVDFPSTSDSMITVTPTTLPTRSQLDNVTLRHYVGYYGGLVLGISFNITYSIPGSSNPEYYTYTYTVDGNATIEVSIGSNIPYIPPEEDPEETYYSLTISSINADTSPDNGTTRVIEGSNQTITISPTDPQLTLALDNGVDITSQLRGGVPTNTYTVDTQVSGASYGFNLNNSTGYYVSTNNGVSKSASVARLNMNFESECLITIQYINYAEEDYDYGMFGKLDTEVATDGLTASSGGSSPSDSTSNYQLARCSNSSSAQTITYEVPMGEHFIDIKYGKDDASDSGNDSLQWKVLSVEATSAGGDYTYTLTNITQKHSLIFVFGDVTFYYINSSTTSGGRIFPDGQQVKLEGDSYKINIVPDNINSAVTITDNGTNVTAQLEQKTGTDKNNNPVVSYSYNLRNIQAAHTLFVTIGEVTTQIYIKENGTWVPYSKVYKKINGSWVEQSDLSSVFSTTANYVKGN